MNPHHGRASVCPQEPVTPVILAGRAWTARHIANNCLRQHCHALARSFRRSDLEGLKTLCARIFTVVETRSRILHEIHPNEIAVVSAVARLGAYAECWLREPEDWRPRAEDDAQVQWMHLLRHLLAKYEVPRFLDSAWLVKGSLLHFERDCWCALGFGRSLREVKGFPQSVSNRVLHQALVSNKGASLAEAVWHAQLQQMRASPVLHDAVMSSRVPKQLHEHALWMRLTAKFVGADDAVCSHFAFLADSLVAVNAHRGPAQLERLMTLPLSDLVRHCGRFVSELLKSNGHLLSPEQLRTAAEKAQLSKMVASSWAPILGSEPLQTGHWRIDELCSLTSLKQEGMTMSHCVAGYARRCKEGSSAIFSLRHFETDAEGTNRAVSYATIEVHPASRKIVQIRAARNRPVNNSCQRMIHEWAQRNDLY